MAGRGISIDILANVRDALKGTGDVEQALSDVESTLEDMARSGDQSVDKMSRGFRDLARKSDDSADKIERSYKDAYRDIGRAADDTADDAVRAQRRMGDQAEEVGTEIRQNLGEGIANAARGDFEGLADVIGDTLGGAVSGIGGIGTAAIGIAGALGIGAIAAAMQGIQEQQEELKQSAAEWADAFTESGGKIVSSAHITAEVQAIATDPERYEKAKQNAKDWGVSVADAMRTMAGDATALALAQAGLNDKQREWSETLEEVTTGPNAQGFTSLTGEQQERMQELAQEIKRGTESLALQNEAMAMGQEQARNSARALFEYAQQVGVASGETDDLHNKIVTMPDGKQVVLDVESRTASENLDAFEERAKRLPDPTVTLKVNTSLAERAARNLINGLNRETATITINSRFGRRFGG